MKTLKMTIEFWKEGTILAGWFDDDEGVGEVLPKLDTYPFKIKYIIEPRGRGYVDLHVFYNRLFS